jgi:hypothetical protein
MTSETGKYRHGWRRAVTGGVASGALAVGLLAGVTAPTALAEPATPTTDADAPPTPTMTADEALAIIAADYDTGAGGGQLSNLIHDVLTLRALGFKPSNANKVAIEEALEKRPNQAPLIEALTNTLAYQRNQQARANAAVAPQNGFNMGMNQLPPGVPPDPSNPDNSGVYIAPGGGINQPIG